MITSHIKIFQLSCIFLISAHHCPAKQLLILPQFSCHMYFHDPDVFNVLCSLTCWWALGSSYRSHTLHNWSLRDVPCATVFYFLRHDTDYEWIFSLIRIILKLFLQNSSLKVSMFFSSVCEMVHDSHRQVSQERSMI